MRFFLLCLTYPTNKLKPIIVVREAPTSQTDNEKAKTPEEQDNDSTVKTNEQDDVEKSTAHEPSSTIEDNAESESPLETDKPKPTELPLVEPTKTGENLKMFNNGDGARQFLIYLS